MSCSTLPALNGGPGFERGPGAEVLLRLLKYRHTFRPDSQFSAWMYHVARDAEIDHFRKHEHAGEVGHAVTMTQRLRSPARA